MKMPALALSLICFAGIAHAEVVLEGALDPSVEDAVGLGQLGSTPVTFDVDTSPAPEAFDPLASMPVSVSAAGIFDLLAQNGGGLGGRGTHALLESTSASVPLPTAVWLLLSGLIAVAAIGRVRRPEAAAAPA